MIRRAGSRSAAGRGLALACLWALAAAAAWAEAPAPSNQAAAAGRAEARALLKRVDEAMAFDECFMRIELEDAKASGSVRRLGAGILYAKGAGTLVSFDSPPREKGKRILMIGDSMWLGAPGISKPLRLSGKDAFMGTSFTNDDVMNMDKEDDYEARILDSGPGGWTLELSARRRGLPYQRSVLVVGPDCLPLRQAMYLLSGELSKTIAFSEPRLYGGRLRPSAIRVEDAMAAGASTTIRFEEIEERRVDRSRLSPSGFMK